MRSSALTFALLLASASPAFAQSPPPAAEEQSLQARVEAILATAPAGTRWGLLVVDSEGREVVAIDPDQRFIPASNTKLFVTAAAYASGIEMGRPDQAGGAVVALVDEKESPPSVSTYNAVLIGRGDARLSSAAECVTNCLAALADAVAARTRSVRNIYGDESLWPTQLWSPGMSWNNIGTDSGTAISALNLDNNEIAIKVRPGVRGQPPAIESNGYFVVRNDALTGDPGSTNTLAIEREVNSLELRIHGQIPSDAGEWRELVGIDNPAHYAVWSLERMLRARGVAVTGIVGTINRPVADVDLVHEIVEPPRPVVISYAPLAELVPPPLAEDVVIINKVSQNLHAQALFRRIGDINGTGSDAWSAATLHGILERAGIPRAGYDFSDGSGMSTYNRVSPRAAIALLRWTQTQPWGAEWRASLPIGGVDGTLRRRFAGTPLEGKVFAKTGTLNATNALSGYLIAASGRELTFSFFANDVPNGGNAVPAMDAALLAIAAAN